MPSSLVDVRVAAVWQRGQAEPEHMWSVVSAPRTTPVRPVDGRCSPFPCICTSTTPAHLTADASERHSSWHVLKTLTELTNVNHFDSANNISLQFGHRGKVAIFIDGNNLFHAARFHNIDIDYNKLLRVLLGDGRLFRAFFYTGVDAGAERQQGFLLWMRRN